VRRSILSSVLSLAVLCTPLAALADNWPAWRGPTGQGFCAEDAARLPLEWGPDKDVKWKVPLPGPGNSTPIVWEKRVFLTQATERGKKRATWCLDRADGKVLWQREVDYAEEEPTHGDNPYCSASAVTDGERLVVSHGSAGVFSYDLDGRELWRRDLGKFRHIWGNAASPVIWKHLVLLNCGPGPRTFLIALDKKSGDQVWKVEISGGEEGGGGQSTWTGSWSTPLVVAEPATSTSPAREVLLASYPDRLRAYDPASGEELWSCGGLGRLVYTSPIAREGVAVAMSGFMGPPLAVRLGGKGDVTESHRLWREERAQQHIGSGVIIDAHIFVHNDPGTLECIELRTGKLLWREKLAGSSWSSIVHAGDRLYTTDAEGNCVVVRASTKFEVLARNSLKERTRASIAVSDGELFIRTYQHLWCIAQAEATRAAK
jgi:outer membrane protein assembly factor BamB